MKSTISMAAALFFLYSLQAQDTSSVKPSLAPAEGTLTLSTAPLGADVFIDSVYVGRTPVKQKRLAAGRHVVRIFSPSVTSWDPFVKSESLEVRAGEEVIRSSDVGIRSTINSIPSSARILQGETELGTTPFFFKTLGGANLKLFLRKDGYEDTPISFGDSAVQSPFVRLKPLNSEVPSMQAEVFTGMQPTTKSKEWLAIASGATMVVSGVVAAYLKDQANHKFDAYLLTQQSDLLSSTHSLDAAAAISFAITQISFGLLAYLFLLE